MDKSTLTLQQALDLTYRDNWQHRRDKGACLMSQAKASITDLNVAAMDYAPSLPLAVHEVTPKLVRTVTAGWYADGLSPATITKRLNCLSVLGVNVEGLRPPEKTALKWWLRPEEEDRAVERLRRNGGLYPNQEHSLRLAIFIQWTTKTGLRVEESLRLTRSDFAEAFKAVCVPGLKTATSQATLPLSTDAQMAIYPLVRGSGFITGVPIFGLTYKELEAAWGQLRAHMGWPPEATLKALRRSAARYLHVDCGMPLDLVRCYLRHEKIETTLGYLRLTGGYSDAEFRKYLK